MVGERNRGTGYEGASCMVLGGQACYTCNRTVTSVNVFSPVDKAVDTYYWA
jgi:hypothetical protein